MPVVIEFHPLDIPVPQWKDATGWSDLSDAEGFIMVWPNGFENSRNAGRCCRAAYEQGVDDVAFTRALIQSLQMDACIDGKRVYATGCSNGGGMAYRVACDAADVIAAVAPVDFDCVMGPNGESSCASCSPSRPISEIQFRATNDSDVPYEGGPRPGGTTEHAGAESNFAEWGEINQCTGSPEQLAQNPSCRTYPACGGGVETTLCTVESGSHCGNYGSFGIVDLAWERLQNSTLP